MAKYSQKFIDEAHDLKESGLTIKEVAKKLKLKVNQANYILYSRERSHKRAQLAKDFGQDIYRDTDKAVKEVDTILKRIKRLLFGA